ncbi:MAG: GIY-YIG nuclease family protein [Candidatus Flemingiibacterium sp.]
MALKLPRIEVASCERSEITQAGVYFLFCRGDDNTESSVYIGEAENVKERLIQHLRDYQAEKEPYYWNTVVIFTGRDLNKAHIRYLENRLVDIVRKCKRCSVLTKNTYKNTVLKESQKAVMEEFIDNIKIIITALGYKVLEPILQQDTTSPENDILLNISTNTIKAVGKVTYEGFVLLKGSNVNENNAKSLRDGIVKLREKYFGNGTVENLTTTEDILFSSSSAAAEFVLGFSVSGPQAWKTDDGRTLKQIEEGAMSDRQ